MPLNHLGHDHVEEVFTPAGARMRPAESHATVKDRERGDPELLKDKNVQRAIQRVETLKQARQSAQVIARAEARVQDAMLDAQERRAAKFNKERTAAIEAEKAKQRGRIEREHIQRMTGFAQVAVKIGKVLVSIKVDRNMESTARQFALTDSTRAIQIAVRESQRMASFAQQGLVVEQGDTDRLVAELSDYLRRSISTGDTEISVME